MTNPKHAAWAAARETGVPVPAIAAEAGVTTAQVYQATRKLAFMAPRRRGRRPAQVGAPAAEQSTKGRHVAWATAREAGIPVPAIAADAGVTPSQVYQATRELVPARLTRPRAPFGTRSMSPLSVALLRFRKVRNLSQEGAARLLGVDRDTFCQWENGTRLPALPVTVEKLMNALDRLDGITLT